MKVNKTNFEHAAYAALMQMIVFFITSDIVAGALFGTGFFLGREHAQFEKKLSKDANSLSPFDGFRFWKWSTDSKLDLIFPIITNVSIYLIYEVAK